MTFSRRVTIYCAGLFMQGDQQDVRFYDIYTFYMFLNVNPQGQNNTQVYNFTTQVHTHRVALGCLMELTSSCVILTQGHPKCTGSLNFSAGLDVQCCYFNQKFSGFPMCLKIN